MGRVFEHPDRSSGWTCPVCQSASDSPVTLIPVYDEETGEVIEATQIHVACLMEKIVYFPTERCETGSGFYGFEIRR